MWDSTGQSGSWSYNDTEGDHRIYAIDNTGDKSPDHFVNGTEDGRYYDPATGNDGNIEDLTLQDGRPTRDLDFNNRGR
jgi:hypothetical protein